ncbi:MAG: DUF86 domain-containing protein [Candidatus Tectomicrobia bacterium]|uniref:DUF86 domain-containing protein n=1 Tax=Tectimicrobiota bacterium TaxID=2528274 RepID=A0A933GPQ4_UNCTE|nr:DUF86 domain-containing protein [Candidatus Tectomicrobia bacterium]
MTEFSYARGRIIESISFISEEMKEFQEEYSGKSWMDYREDRKIQKLMDRTVENVLTALIEVCGTFLTKQRLAVESYGEALKKTGSVPGFSEVKQEDLLKLAVQRNRLAHRYLNFRWQAIKAFMDNNPCHIKFSQFRAFEADIYQGGMLAGK